MPGPGEHLRLRPLLLNRCAKTKKYGPNERTDQSSNLSDAEFKTLVIGMLTELVEYGYKIKEKVKVMKSEINKIYREPTVKGRKPGFKSTMWSRGRSKQQP